MSILPPEVRAGYVYDRVLRAIGDRPYDDDRLPDGIPAQGKVIFRPKNAVKQVVSEGRGVTVTREPVTCTIHQGENQPDDPDASKGGLLIDEAGAVGGVWLVVGEWTVEYHMEDRYSNIPNEEIIVTEEHTEDNPLDVALASEITPSPTIKFVVNEQIYVDSKNYRDEALEFRNDAQEAFEKFTWPVQVQDTPPENTNVIWVNPDEPAGTASDYARRAEEMYEASKALGITVDESVGERIFVGDTMIYGDTGRREITNLFDGTAPNASSPIAGGEVFLTRVGRLVEIIFENVTLPEGHSTSYVEMGDVIPRGFQPPHQIDLPAGARLTIEAQNTASLRINRLTGRTYVYQLSSGATFRLVANYFTEDPWPTELPGTPA